MGERRQSIRIGSFLKVSFRNIDGFLLRSSQSKDFSTGGICLPSEQRFEPGEILELKIHLKEDARPIEAIGQVVWLSRRDNPECPFLVGIKFVNIEPSDRDKLLNYIKSLEENKFRDVDWIDSF